MRALGSHLRTRDLFAINTRAYARTCGRWLKPANRNYTYCGESDTNWFSNVKLHFCYPLQLPWDSFATARKWQNARRCHFELRQTTFILLYYIILYYSLDILLITINYIFYYINSTAILNVSVFRKLSTKAQIYSEGIKVSSGDLYFCYYDAIYETRILSYLFLFYTSNL